MERLETAEDVAKWVRNGLIAIAFQVVVTVLFVGVGALVEISASYAALADPANLLDVVLLLVFAAGIHFRSRAAAVSLATYYVLARLLLLSEGALAVGSLVSAVFFLYIYARTIEACFLHHRLRREEDSSYRPRVLPLLATTIGVGVLGSCLFVGFVFYEFSSATSAAELTTAQIEALRQAAILEPDETPLEGSFSPTAVEEAGTVITERRVIVFYRELTGELTVESRERSQILDVYVEPNDPLDSATLVVLCAAAPTPLEAVFADAAIAERLAAYLNIHRPASPSSARSPSIEGGAPAPARGARTSPGVQARPEDPLHPAEPRERHGIG